MAFTLTAADEDALRDVEIIVDGINDRIILDQDTLMFPPIITKDTKSAKWLEVMPAGAYEPFKQYEQGKPREIALKFQWVTGTFKKTRPSDLHNTISKIKSYFYRAYFDTENFKNRKEYPIVQIKKLYGLINGQQGGKYSAWRFDSVDIKYSDELIRIEGDWYPLHVELTMNLESVSQMGKPGQVEDKGVYSVFTNLPNSPKESWF